MRKELKALYKELPCSGVIEILSKTDNTAYVSWSFYDQGNKVVASFSNSYFFEKATSDDEEIFNRVKNQIAKYRIGRLKPFSNIEFEVT